MENYCIKTLLAILLVWQMTISIGFTLSEHEILRFEYRIDGPAADAEVVRHAAVVPTANYLVSAQESVELESQRSDSWASASFVPKPKSMQTVRRELQTVVSNDWCSSQQPNRSSICSTICQPGFENICPVSPLCSVHSWVAKLRGGFYCVLIP